MMCDPFGNRKANPNILHKTYGSVRGGASKKNQNCELIRKRLTLERFDAGRPSGRAQLVGFGRSLRISRTCRTYPEHGEAEGEKVSCRGMKIWPPSESRP